MCLDLAEGIIPKQRSTVYINPNIWKAFKIICLREDVSISEKIEAFIARYIAVHQKGNPQLNLDPFIEDIKAKCFNCEGFYPSLIRVKFVSGLVANICKECLEEKRGRGLVKKVIAE